MYLVDKSCLQSHAPIYALDLLCLCQVLFMTGWSPHKSQQRAAARGSATVSFQVGKLNDLGSDFAPQLAVTRASMVP